MGVEWAEEMEEIKTKTKTRKLNYIMSKFPGKFKIFKTLVLIMTIKGDTAESNDCSDLPGSHSLSQSHVYFILQVHWSRKIKTKPIWYE